MSVISLASLSLSLAPHLAPCNHKPITVVSLTDLVEKASAAVEAITAELEHQNNPYV